MNQEQLKEVYKMVDNIPFSKPKKNISRDFSDGVMLAELLYFYNPKLVALHNYPPANSTAKKIENWTTLNSKALKKIDLPITKQQIEEIVNCVPGIIEQLLYQIFLKFQKPQEEGNLINQVRVMDSRKIDPNIEENWQNKANKERTNQKTKSSPNLNVSSQAEEIIRLVQKIDQATLRLNKVRQQSKLKDEIINNLQKQLEKVIFS